MMQFSNRLRTLPDANRRALVREWETKAAEGASPDAALHLAVVLYHSDRLVPYALVRARALLDAYLAEGKSKPAAMIDFARLQLGMVEDKERLHTVIDQERQTRSELERERRARIELEHKLEALKAIERRMTDKDGNDKVPLR